MGAAPSKAEVEKKIADRGLSPELCRLYRLTPDSFDEIQDGITPEEVAGCVSQLKFQPLIQHRPTALPDLCSLV